MSAATRAARTGVVATAIAVSATYERRPSLRGAGDGSSSGRSSGASGVRSKMSDANSAACRPSMHA